MRINGEGAPALTIGMLTGRSRERQRPSFNCSSRRTTARYVYSRRQRPHTMTGRVAVVLLAVAILIGTLVLAKRLGSSSFFHGFLVAVGVFLSIDIVVVHWIFRLHRVTAGPEANVIEPILVAA